MGICCEVFATCLRSLRTMRSALSLLSSLQVQCLQTHCDASRPNLLRHLAHAAQGMTATSPCNQLEASTADRDAPTSLPRSHAVRSISSGARQQAPSTPLSSCSGISSSSGNSSSFMTALAGCSGRGVSCATSTSTSHWSLQRSYSSQAQAQAQARALKEEDVHIAREAAKARASGRRRFYRTVEVREAPAGTHSSGATPSGAHPSGSWSLYLGKYPIRTPARHVLRLPTKALALAIAAEWEWQENSKPAMHSMPLMGLAATAIDQPKPRAKVIETLLKYVHTDSALCRYEPGPIADRQAQVFDPVVEWARSHYGWESLHASDSIFGTQQAPEVAEGASQVVEGASQVLHNLDPWRLAAAEQLTYCSKSLLVALAMMHIKMSIEDGIAAARLEEAFQTEEWGEVEAGHDLDKADVGSRMGAPLLLLRLMDTRLVQG